MTMRKVWPSPSRLYRTQQNYVQTPCTDLHANWETNKKTANKNEGTPKKKEKTLLHRFHETQKYTLPLYYVPVYKNSPSMKEVCKNTGTD